MLRQILEARAKGAVSAYLVAAVAALTTSTA